MNHLVGVIEFASKYRYGFTSHGVPLYLFRPYGDDSIECIVGSRHRDLSVNQIAIVEMSASASASASSPLQKPRVNLVRLLGPVGDYTAERAGLLYHYCPYRLTPAEIDPTDTSRDPDRIEISKSTGWHVFHVDPPGCRDVDDAIAFHPDTGRWAITIADVAAAVPVGSALDLCARDIGSTFYDTEGRVVRPMLPPELSENAASLLPGERRRGVSLIWKPSTMEELTHVSDPVFVSSWITVEYSFTYDDFPTSHFARETLGLSCYGDLDSHEWIAALMICYNTAAAHVLKNKGGGSGGILRIQPPALAEKVAAWSFSPDLKHLAMESAVYAAVDSEEASVGHIGLGLAAYTHASSPLRRYADLINQRALLGLVSLPDVEHLNTRAKANKRWGRDMTFLTHVVPGRVLNVDIIFVTADRVWVPVWKRLLRLRHTPSTPVEPGAAGRIAIFCDPTRRNWKQRILTADSTTDALVPPSPLSSASNTIHAEVVSHL